MATSKSKLELLFAVAGSFAGGFLLGLLMAPKSGKESRDWITKQTDDVTDWIDKKGKEAIQSTEKQLHSISSNIRSNVKKSIPDLYSATEGLSFEEEELME